MARSSLSKVLAVRVFLGWWDLLLVEFLGKVSEEPAAVADTHGKWTLLVNTLLLLCLRWTSDVWDWLYSVC